LGDQTTSTFLFTVDGVEIGEFTEVRGLEMHVDVVRYAEAGANGYVHQLPGRVQWPNLVLVGGLTKGDNLFKWVLECTGDKLEANGNKLTRRTGALTSMRTDGTPMRSWEFDGAFPVRWIGPRFAVDEKATPVEEIEIAHHGFRPRELG
jgi:phage tail-like protein